MLFIELVEIFFIYLHDSYDPALNVVILHYLYVEWTGLNQDWWPSFMTEWWLALQAIYNYTDDDVEYYLFLLYHTAHDTRTQLDS